MRFSLQFTQAHKPTQPPIQRVPSVLLWMKPPDHFSEHLPPSSAEETMGSWYKLPGFDGPAGTRGPNCCICFCISRCYYYLSFYQLIHSGQANFVNESWYFRFSVKIISRSALPVGSKFFFLLGLEPDLFV